VKKPVVAAKKVAAKQSKSLGQEPVVLVPPSSPEAALAPPSEGTAAASLYGEEGAVASTAPVATQPVAKKKKTLADLFNSTASDTTQLTQSAEPAPVPPVAPKPAQKQVQQKPVTPEAPAPSETQVAAAAGYVAQLASFRTRQEASTEFGRLKSRHGAILQGATPIINEATVAGSTRYRLAVGGFATKEQASALCGKLFAAGERDCLVKRQ
jgi:cell division protein FtsN